MDDDKITNIKDAPKKSGRQSKPALTKGDFLHPVGVTFIANVLKVDKGVVARDLTGLTPVSTEGDPRYKFHEAAKRVILARAQKSATPTSGTPTLEQIAELTPDKFPKNAHAEFWNGMTRRREFYEQANQLWSTDKVQEAFDDVVDVFRTAIMSLGDRVREAQRDNKDLDLVQREILNEVHKEAIKVVTALSTQSIAGEYSLWEDRIANGSQEDLPAPNTFKNDPDA